MMPEFPPELKKLRDCGILENVYNNWLSLARFPATGKPLILSKIQAYFYRGINQSMLLQSSIHERLADIRKDLKLTLDDVSSATGIAVSSLNSYENDEGIRIPHTALASLADYYHVSADYLLGLTENRDSGASEIKDLKIDDRLVSLLKEGGLNNRLISELLSHPSFPKFLTDIEIYVDGLANIQIQTLNAVVDTIRASILKFESPEEAENDKNLTLLETSLVEDDDYFFNMINHDLNLIIKDLRESHKKDPLSADDDIVSKPINDAINRVNEIKSSHDSYKTQLLETYIHFFTEGIKIKETSLSVAEKGILSAIIERSPAYKNSLRSKNTTKHLNKMKKSKNR